MKKNKIVAYLSIFVCAYAPTSIMGITPPSISFYESIKTPQWIKNPTQQAYVQTLLNRMPQRLSVFARKNPYTAALIAAILSSGGIYSGYAGLKWAWKSQQRAHVAKKRKDQFKKKWKQEKDNIAKQVDELKTQLDSKRPHATSEQETAIIDQYRLLVKSGLKLQDAMNSLISLQNMSNIYELYSNSVVPKQKEFVEAKKALSHLLNSIPDAAPAE